MNEQNTETSVTCKVPENTKIKRWQTIAVVIASFLGIVLIIDLLSMGLASFFSLLGFIIIPAVFAFPVIIGKYRLLPIPIGIFLLVSTFFYVNIYPELIGFLNVVLALFGGFGAVAGGLVRWVRSAKGTKKIVILAVSVFIGMLPLLLFINFLRLYLQ